MFINKRGNIKEALFSQYTENARMGWGDEYEYEYSVCVRKKQCRDTLL